MCELVSVELRQQLGPSVYQYRSAEHITVDSNKLRQGFRQKSLGVAEPRARNVLTQRSLFAWRAKCTVFGISDRRNTYQKSTVISYLMPLDFQLRSNVKMPYRFLSACTRKNIRHFLFIRGITQNRPYIKQKASLLRDSIYEEQFKYSLKTE